MVFSVFFARIQRMKQVWKNQFEVNQEGLEPSDPLDFQISKVQRRLESAVNVVDRWVVLNVEQAVPRVQEEEEA